MRQTDENIQAVTSEPEQEPAKAKEKSSIWKKKSARKLLMIAAAVGIVAVGVAFGLPPVFATKKEPGEVPDKEQRTGE